MSIVLVAFAAAHEGEEFVIALPIVMLVAAFFGLKVQVDPAVWVIP